MNLWAPNLEKQSDRTLSLFKLYTKQKNRQHDGILGDFGKYAFREDFAFNAKMLFETNVFKRKSIWF